MHSELFNAPLTKMGHLSHLLIKVSGVFHNPLWKWLLLLWKPIDDILWTGWKALEFLAAGWSFDSNRNILMVNQKHKSNSNKCQLKLKDLLLLCNQLIVKTKWWHSLDRMKSLEIFSCSQLVFNEALTLTGILTNANLNWNVCCFCVTNWWHSLATMKKLRIFSCVDATGQWSFDSNSNIKKVYRVATNGNLNQLSPFVPFVPKGYRNGQSIAVRKWRTKIIGIVSGSSCLSISSVHLFFASAAFVVPTKIEKVFNNQSRAKK